jgi:phosphopantothenoylcysteine decarboxylase
MNILLGVTGSVAAVYTLKLIDELLVAGHDVKVVKTNSALIDYSINISCNRDFKIYDETSETWNKLGDKILHIDLRKWADILIIAPLSANTMAKIVHGLCDNLLTDVVRAWDYSKPFIVCPSMNTHMFENDPTSEQIEILTNRSIIVIPPVIKTLACGDTGIGAMCDHQSIINALACWQAPIKGEIFIPTGDHPGAFGIKRKYDIHTGVDVYCEDGTPVYAVEDSEYIDCDWFTGKNVFTPWWNDTMYVVLRGKSGFILYGEITQNQNIKRYIKAGDLVGWVKAVLPPEKKRDDIPHHSNAMLHMELYTTFNNWVTWSHGAKLPKYLKNPTPYLKSIRNSIL